jgi:CubicO group peptidase (beta-lactamase class C family)
MRHWLAGLSIAAAVWAWSVDLAFGQAAPAEPPPLEQVSALPGLETYLDGVVNGLTAAHDLPGGTVAVVENGAIVLTKGYGFADVARMQPVDPAMTLFRPGSISKPFTWIAVMQLVEQGKVDLDADVNTYLTQFKVPEAYGEPVTVAHLLAHTAGFEDGAVGYLFHRDAGKLTSLADALKRRMPKRVRPPGEFSAYSNWGAALAGLIVENVSGQPFADYVTAEILEPLGMRQSTFREPPETAVSARMSAGFSRRLGDHVDGGFEYISDFGPAGALSSTSVDMAKFMLAMLNDGSLDGRQVLKPETARRMRTPLFAHDERLPAMLYGFMQVDANGRFAYGHGGDTIHFHSDMILLPEEKVGIFVTFNSPDGGKAAREVTRAFLKAYFPRAGGDPHPDPDEANENGRPSDLARYAGTYRGNRRSYTTYEKITALGSEASVSLAPRGGLLLAMGGEQRRLVPAGEDLFRSVDDPGMRVAFRVEGDGPATHFFVSGFPAIAFDRVGWLESSGLHIPAMILCLIVFAGVAAGSIWGVGKWRKMTPVEKLARGLVFAGSVLFLVFVLALEIGVSAAGENLVFTGVPGLAVLVWLPLLAATAAMAAAGVLVPVWTTQAWSLFGRIRHTIVVVLLLLASGLVVYWNLLGPWVL